MAQEKVHQLSDWLSDNLQKIADKQVSLDAKRIYAALDTLGVLKKPAQEYLTLTEDQYYPMQKQHLLTLSHGSKLLVDMTDRIMISHVDGILEEDNLNFEYLHHRIYAPDYQVKADLEVLTYGLAVVGAVSVTQKQQLIPTKLDQDAVVCLVVAAHNIEKWQQNN